MRLLLDERIEHGVYKKLANDGHDVTHAERSERVQKGADDAELTDPLDERRVIATEDDDFRLELTDEE